MHLCPEPLVVPLMILFSLQVSSLEGVGCPSSARLAVSFLAIIDSAADNPPRLQRPIAESRHGCSDSTHIGCIDDVTTAALNEETL